MDKTILLQKQIRDNSEDLQREFLDVKAWEEQMKKKDLEIRNSKDDRVLPPVRTKKKKKSAPSPEPGTSQESKPNKAKRIAGHDYSAWDKFDANKACKEVDGKKEEEEKVLEIPSKEELEKEHEEANKFKDEGNELVKKQEYAKAVGKYSQAIKIFPYDAVFYANRALCHLKLDNLYSAESDCTDAIKRDEHYVKAYHRRATARMELKRYKDAVTDIEMVLKLDPSNKEATSMLAQAQKKLENAKSSTITTADKNEKSSIEKKIGEKLFANIGKSSSKEKISKPVEEKKNKKVKIEEIQPSTSQDNKTLSQTVEEKKKATCNTIKTVEKEASSTIDKSNKETKDLPPWLPELKEGVKIVEPLTEAPRRLNKTLKRIDIKEISPTESIFKDIEKIDRSIGKTTEEISEVKCIKKTDSKSDNKICDAINNKNEEVEEAFPPAPKSSVAFLLNWRKHVSPDFRYKYLKQIRPEDFPGIFKESMESNIFSDVLLILSTKFVVNGDKTYDYLSYLAKVKRFRALILFMTEADKEALNTLFKYCKTKEGKTEEEIKSLTSAYEM